MRLPADPLTVAYLFTTFPKSTETFLQREVSMMRSHGHHVRVYSLIDGGGDFQGLPVDRFSRWRMPALLWIIPCLAVSRWEVFGILWRGLWRRRPPAWLNFWENMLGAGFAAVYYPHFRRHPPDLIHAAWGGAPATAAWILHRLNGHRYSAAAHAYDIYEHGGDWWLNEKLAEARFIHTSTQMGRRSLRERGLDADQIQVVRRGLDVFPVCRPLRPRRDPLRLICIARLVAKKGLPHQLRIHAALQRAGIEFAARIVGEGPERGALESLIRELALDAKVSLTGHLDQPAVWQQLDWADVLLHTGVVAASGDRDGLPNVIPEAMAAGVVVLTSPHAATTEAVKDGQSGFVLREDCPETWVEKLHLIRDCDETAQSLRLAGRRWTEENYDGRRNAEKLAGLFERAVQ